MNCRHIKLQLPDYLRSAAQPAQDDAHAAIAAHLASCPACRSEAELLSELFTEIDQAIPWSPSESYWQSFLPRIHRRMDSTPGFAARSVRFALPLSAALAMTILLVRLVPTEFEDHATDVQSILLQLPQDQIQELADRQSVTEAVEPRPGPVDSGTAASDDVDIIRELLQTGEQIEMSPESYADTEELTGPEANELASLLEKQTP